MNKVDLSIDFCGLHFANPFLLSSSPVSNSAEMIERAFEQGWAGVCYKTLNSDRIPIIHPSPRMAPYHYEGRRMVGLQNVEQISDRPLKDNLADFRYLKKRYPERPIIASIMGFSNDEWAWLAKAAADNGADMLELNFSCPHMTVEGSGHKVGQAFHLLEKFTATVKNAVKIPVLAKMTPNITDMTEPALYAKKGGADGICIGHGTDTMHHTAAILTFMVQNSPVPIVMVGSQRSSDRPSSDAALNLIHAVRAAGKGEIAEVVICMFGPTSDQYALLHRGTRCRKMHSSYRSTFRTIGDIPLATVSRDQTLRLWDLASGAILLTIAAPRDWFSAVALSPDEKIIAAATQTVTLEGVA